MTDLREVGRRLRSEAIDSTLKHRVPDVLHQYRLWRTGAIDRDQYEQEIDAIEENEMLFAARRRGVGVVERARESGAI